MLNHKCIERSQKKKFKFTTVISSAATKKAKRLSTLHESIESIGYYFIFDI